MILCFVVISLYFGYYSCCPTGYVYCADERATCSGTGPIAYGFGTTYTYKLITATSFACDNAVFGDPLSGTGKECCTQSPTITGIKSPIVHTISCGDTKTINWVDNGDALSADNKHFFKLTTSNSNDITYSTCGSAFNTRLHVFDSLNVIISEPYCTSGSTKTGDDCNVCTTNNEFFTIPALLPDTYYIRIKSFTNGAYGDYTLSVTCKILTATPTSYPTAHPTTAQPSTSQPTTVQPTTAHPTTTQPTTTQPTSVNPTVTPTNNPSLSPSRDPSNDPTNRPTVRNTNEPVETEETSDSFSSNRETSTASISLDDIMLVTIIIIVVFCVCIVLVLFFFYRRKKKIEDMISKFGASSHGTDAIELGVTSPQSEAEAEAEMNRSRSLDRVTSMSNDMMNNPMMNMPIQLYTADPMMNMPGAVGTGAAGQSQMNQMASNMNAMPMNQMVNDGSYAMSLDINMMQQNFGINPNMAQFYMNQMNTSPQMSGENGSGVSADLQYQRNNQMYGMPNLSPLHGLPANVNNNEQY